MSEDAKKVVEQYRVALEKRRWIEPEIDSAYEYALPLRQRLYHSGKRPETDRLFDSTAVIALQQFASQMLNDVWPVDSEPFVLVPGPDVDPRRHETIKTELKAISERIIDLVNNSSFRSAAHEAFLDFGIGTGVLMVLPGDVVQPLKFVAVPLTECVLDIGGGEEPVIEDMFRPREMEIRHVPVTYPAANLPQEWAELLKRNPNAKVKVIERTYRDRVDTPPGEERWCFKLVDESGTHLLLEKEWSGAGSCPFLAFSFSRVSGEVMGRGPVMHCLGDIRMLNAQAEMTIEAMDIQLSGVWLYDDDGVINPDTAIMTPGALIPRTPGQKGLEPITPNLNVQLSWQQIERMRSDVRDALFVPSIGPGGKTPPSATQVMEESAQKAQRLAGPYGRLLVELLFPLVQRVFWLMRHSPIVSRTAGLPAIDQSRIKFRPLAPISRSLTQTTVLRQTRFLDIVGTYFGPQAVALAVDAEKFIPALADQVGFDTRLLRDEQSKKKMVEMVTAAAQAQQGGQAPQAPAPMPA